MRVYSRLVNIYGDLVTFSNNYNKFLLAKTEMFEKTDEDLY